MIDTAPWRQQPPIDSYAAARVRVYYLRVTLGREALLYYLTGLMRGQWPANGYARYLMAAAFRDALRG